MCRVGIRANIDTEISLYPLSLSVSPHALSVLLSEIDVEIIIAIVSLPFNAFPLNALNSDRVFMYINIRSKQHPFPLLGEQEYSDGKT